MDKQLVVVDSQNPSQAAAIAGHFVDDVPHAHVDIAGPVWSGKDSCATGFGAKTMAAWVEARAAASDFGAPF